MAGSVDTLRRGWDVLKSVPGGKSLFSWMIGRAVPYTGSIRATVLDLEVGYSRVAMEDRPALRNHLNCVHAIALANLVEVTGNIAMVYSLPPNTRFIVTQIEIEYLKKARGRLIAECHYKPPTSVPENMPASVEVVVHDREGDVVVRGRCKSQIGPVTKR